MDDPDLQQLLKQAQEMQKNAHDLQKNPRSLNTRKKLADMEAMAKQQAAQQEQEEKSEKEELQAALKKQLDAPGPVAFPDWTPVTPEFKPAGKPTKKLIDEEVKIVQSGTSSLTPEQMADSWESATVVKEKNLSRAGTTSTLTAKSPGSFSQHPNRSGRKSRTGSLPRVQQQSNPGRNLLPPAKAEHRKRIGSSATPHRWLSR
jgi:hypothetical protein